jgi:hypothetical protein
VSDERPTATAELKGLLSRLQEAQRALMKAVAEAAPERFERSIAEGDSIKRILERSADDVNFYYGRLVAQALSLPQPPGMETADFGSLAEAKASLLLAHRRFSRLLHDLTVADLKRKTRLESTAEYTLRQVLETAVAHYRLRTDQLRNLGEGASKKGA